MAVSTNWGSCVLVVRALLLGAYTGAPDFWKLPSAVGSSTPSPIHEVVTMDYKHSSFQQVLFAKLNIIWKVWKTYKKRCFW